MLDEAFGAQVETEAEQETSTETESEDTSTEDDSDDNETDDDSDEADDSEDEDSENEDADNDEVPDGMENWPKGAIKRIKKQSAQLRDLKSQLQSATPINIAPTPASPLANVNSLESLESKIATAKNVRRWCQAHPEGDTLTVNGGQVELNADDVAARLARAEAELEAAPDRKDYLKTREQTKPREHAEAIAPGLFTNGTPENQFYVGILKQCPEIAKLDDFEVLLAAAAKGYKMTLEERSGKARYIRMLLDKDGNVIPPKAKAAQPVAKTTATDKPKSKPPVTPQGSKPVMRPPSASAGKSKDEIYAATKGNSGARLDALLDAAFA